MIGKTVSHYRILEKIAEGGMGTIYKAEDTKLKRTVALKFISGQAVKNHQTRTRFMQEAQTAANLNHPNINTIYEIEESEDQVFIAMEFIEGQTLKDRIDSESIPIEESLDIAVQVASGLEAAHDKGFVHRDIKSSNIMLNAQGQAKIMDFGLVKVLHGTQITQTAMVMGTVSYMSPEQAGNKMVDQRSDIWSLGVLLYEMVTGKLPFGDSDSMVVLYSILNKPPKSLGDLTMPVPAQLERIIRKCLEKKPEQRYQTAARLKQDLERLRRDLDTGRIRPYTSTTRFFQRAHTLVRRPWFMAGVGILALVLFLAVFPFRSTLTHLLAPSHIPKTRQGLAVLPFNCIGGSDQDRAFSQGLYVILNSRLTEIQTADPRFWIVPAVEVTEQEIRSAADAQKVFNVDLVLNPNIDYTTGVINVTVNLIDARRQRQLMSRLLSYPKSDRLALAEDIFAAVSDLLDLNISPQVQARMTTGLSPVAEASLFYTRGTGYLQDYRDPESLGFAIDLLTRATEADPGFALAFARLGEAYWRRWDESKQGADLEKADSFCRKSLELNDQLASVRITLGILLRETGDTENAIAEFARALAIDPRSADAHREMARAHQAAGNKHEAERHYRQAISINPAFWGGYSHLGAFYYRTGRPKQAEQAFIKATELAPDNLHGHNLLGGIYYVQGRWQEAESAFRKSLELKPNYRAFSNLGTIFFSQERYGEATEMFEQASRLQPNDHRVWGNLGDSQRYTPGVTGEQAAESYRRASELARLALSINPRAQGTRAFLAFYYAARGDFEHALDEISTILGSGSPDVTVLRLCLRAYEIMGMREKALEMLAAYSRAGGSRDELETNPDLAALVKDPRFAELMR